MSTDQYVDYIWTNTNTLLIKDSFWGVKTGITQLAGGCLQTGFNIQSKKYLAIVLGCTTKENRFNDTLAIY